MKEVVHEDLCHSNLVVKLSSPTRIAVLLIDHQLIVNEFLTARPYEKKVQQNRSQEKSSRFHWPKEDRYFKLFFGYSPKIARNIDDVITFTW